MRLPNLNKVFPFLSIRSKLTIAFVGLSLLSLTVVGVYGFLWSVDALRDSAIDETEQQLHTIQASTGHYFHGIASDLRFLAETVTGTGLDQDGTNAILRDFLRTRPEFYQVLFFDSSGRERFLAQRGDEGVETAARTELRSRGGRYYVEQLRDRGPSRVLIFPSELRGREQGTHVPAITVAIPVIEGEGSGDGPVVKGVRAGIVVGHLFAREFFTILEEQVPPNDGVVAVVNQEGLYLYHSSRKKAWNRLLAERSTDTLFRDLDRSTAQVALSGNTGSTVAADKTLVSYGPLLGGDETASYRVIRWVPHDVVFSRVRSLQRIFVVLGSLAALLAVVVGIVSADQFTRPIRRLQQFASEVALGKPSKPVSIRTNDELELLAEDLDWMATTLRERDEQIRSYAEQLEKKVRHNEAYLSIILHSSADAIFGLDTEGKIQSWNRGAERIFGYSEDEIIGRPIHELVPSELQDVGELERIDRDMRRFGSVSSLETERLHKDGHRLIVNLTRTLLRDEEGKVIGSSSIIKDVSAQKALERRLAQSEKLAAMGRVAGGLAHQIGTPLGVISATAELLEGELPADSETRQDVKTIRSQARVITELVDSLMVFVRRRPGSMEPVELNLLVEEVCSLLQSRLEQSEVAVDLRFDESLPPVSADSRLLREVVVNLMTNAEQAMTTGGVLSVQTRTEVPPGGRVTRRPRAELVVSDTGPGVPPEHLEHVFEPFFTTREVGEGSGLGLALSRQIVEHHEGEIRVRNLPEGGAEFTVVLPVAEADREAEA